MDKVSEVIAALRNFASIDRAWVDANGGPDAAINRIIGDAQAALQASQESGGPQDHIPDAGKKVCEPQGEAGELLSAQRAIDPNTPLLDIVLCQAVDWFEEYAANHSAKGTAEGANKARTNRTRADYLRQARTALRAQPAAGAGPEIVCRRGPYCDCRTPDDAKECDHFSGVLSPTGAAAEMREHHAKVAECAFDDRDKSHRDQENGHLWEDGHRAGTRDAAQAIRNLPLTDGGDA